MSSREIYPVDEHDVADAAEQAAPVNDEPEPVTRPDTPLEVSEADAAEQAAEVPDDDEYDY